MTEEKLKAIVVLAGFWNLLDGVGSIIVYWGQTPLEQLVRILRAGVGFALIWLGESHVLLENDTHQMLQTKIKEMEVAISKLKNHKANDRTVTILRDDLGNSQKRIQELKGEVEEWKGIAGREVENRKALYEEMREGKKS